MMVATGWLGGHPESDALLCFIDRSMAALEQERTAAHLTECEYCQRELALLETQVRSVSAAMSSVGARPVSDIRRAQALVAVRAAARRVEKRRLVRTVWAPRAAAAGIALAVGLVAAGPGMALMRSLFSSDRPSEVVDAPINPAPVVDAPYASASRSWDRAAFPVSFTRGYAGTIEFSIQDGGEAAVHAQGGSHSKDIRFTSSGLTIDDGGVSGASYVLSLPRVVTQVTLQVPGRKPVTFTPIAGKAFDLGELAVGRQVVGPAK